MSARREDVLAEVLAAIAGGEPPEAALARHPEWAEELQDLVQLATDAAMLRPAVVPTESIRRSRARAIAHAATLARPRPRLLPMGLRFAAATAAVVVLCGLSGVGLNSAAADALPGDALYRVKLAAQNLRLRFAAGPDSRLELEDLYAEQRVDDVMTLLSLGRVVPVSFTGEVRSLGTVLWDVAGVKVRRTPETVIFGEILPGMEIEVEGLTQGDGTVLAHKLHVHAYDTVGVFEAFGPGSLTISGFSFAISPAAWIEPGLVPGDRVLARILINDAGTRSAVSVIRFLPPTPTAAPVLPPTSPPAATPTPEPVATDDHKEETPGPGGDETNEPDDDEHGDSEPDKSDDEDEEKDQSEKQEFEGVVDSIGGTIWIVSGRALTVTGATEIRDNPAVGDRVKVVAFSQPDGTWWAERIEVDD